MLVLTIPGAELWDEKTEEFATIPPTTLKLEHSLVSISKWESKINRAFLNNKVSKTQDEILYYVECMIVSQNANSSDIQRVLRNLSKNNFDEIQKYIEAPMTATYLPEDKSAKSSRDVVTSELIYYWMISYAIPFECQKWHLNRLLALIGVCNLKNKPAKKGSMRALMERNKSENERRKALYHTKG